MNKKKIFIVEDDMAILEAMQLLLEEAGYEVTATVNGQTLQGMQEELPDLLLLDIRLSGLNGKDICKHLKSQERTKQFPIILCSANKDIKEIACEAGADDFIAKPFEMNALLAKVERFVDGDQEQFRIVSSSDNQ